ncbi:hypothetical protein BSKO_10667 [Bryopsis sp. KO-2023]|nr:hypothetical protein BSKO_10667 [Bryopsis sp. KO-2023]
MVVRIRLARFGKRNQPFFRLFVADARCRRDGRHIECVGNYDPVPGKDGNRHVGLNMDRIRYWLSVGAQPSDTVSRLLGQAGLIPIPPEKPSSNKKRFARARGEIKETDKK